ncbi:unnamed protein product [Cuscuta europaea]|uniref:Uncharacterized protein n=1 Tax=Cuscuta europaea TaxID=41803 RepID=A0A9P0YZD7_CUSEU|nr:unnamed protein product [Cuscuta europaea]
MGRRGQDQFGQKNTPTNYKAKLTPRSKGKSTTPIESASLDPAKILPSTDDLFEASETFQFFGEEGFDSINIELKTFRFAVTKNDLVILEFKKSSLHRMDFKKNKEPEIFRYINHLSRSDNFKEHRRFGPITVSSNCNNSGWYLKIAKEKGSFIIIPMGPNNSNLITIMAILSNFVGLSNLVQETGMDMLQETMILSEEPKSISKLILESQIREAYSQKQNSPTPVERPLPVQAYSDASDTFYQSDDSGFMDEFLGHATENERRPPISTPEEIRKSKFNRAICRKSKFVTAENCLPTENLNTQLKIYRKPQKNKRRHSMTTRS